MALLASFSCELEQLLTYITTIRSASFLELISPSLDYHDLASLAGPDSEKLRVWANSHSNLVLHCQQSPALIIIFIVNNSIVYNYRSKKFLDPLEPNRYASLPRLLIFQFGPRETMIWRGHLNEATPTNLSLILATFFC